MKIIKYYLNSNKENNYYIWMDEIRNKDSDEDEPDNWRYAFYEVEFEVEVDEITGKYRVISVNIGNGQNKFYESGVSYT
jgi:hypothetical protein